MSRNGKPIVYSPEDLPHLKDIPADPADYTPPDLPVRGLLKQHRQRLRDPKVQRLLRKKDVGKGRRSDAMYALACKLGEAGLPFDHTYVILDALPWNKFAGRKDRVQRVWDTVYRAYEGVGAASKNGHVEVVEEPEYEPVVRSLANVEPEPVDWLWEGLIPLGNLTVLAGRQGLGKSQLAVWIAGQLSNGELYGEYHYRPSHTLLASFEDSTAHAVVPRLMAVKADRKCVHTVSARRSGVEQGLRIPRDVDLIARAAEKVDARLLVIDPLGAAVGGEAFDSHREADVRGALAPLVRVAETHGMAVLAIMHLKKGNEEDALMKVLGSVGYTAAARSVLIFGTDPDSEDERDGRRVLAHAKSNYSHLADSMKWDLIEKNLTAPRTRRRIKTSRLKYAGESAAEVHDLMIIRTGTKLGDAVTWLSGMLVTGSVAVDELKAQAEAVDISYRTLRRASVKLNVVKRPTEFQGEWVWSLPNETGQGGEGDEGG